MPPYTMKSFICTVSFTQQICTDGWQLLQAADVVVDLSSFGHWVDFQGENIQFSDLQVFPGLVCCCHISVMWLTIIRPSVQRGPPPTIMPVSPSSSFSSITVKYQSKSCFWSCKFFSPHKHYVSVRCAHEN